MIVPQRRLGQAATETQYDEVPHIELVVVDGRQCRAEPQSGLWWAPDSRAVMYVFNEHLRVEDLDTRIAFDVVPGLQVSAFAVRPAA